MNYFVASFGFLNQELLREERFEARGHVFGGGPCARQVLWPRFGHGKPDPMGELLPKVAEQQPEGLVQ